MLAVSFAAADSRQTLVPREEKDQGERCQNACASAASAFHLAWMSVASGACDVAVAIGAEKLTHPDKTAVLRAIGTAVPLDDLAVLRENLQLDNAGDSDEKHSLFIDIYAAL